MFSARVKSIVSGDTIAFDNGKQISLAYVSAPRSTEPYGFQSREYLRKFIVGKPVKYRVHYTINNRDYGDVSAPVFTSLIEKSLTDGNVKLRDDAQSRIPFPEIYENYEKAQENAKTENLGLWDPEVASVEVSQIVPDDLYNSGKEYKAIVEKVVAGDRVQIRVIEDNSENSHILTNALIAGIKSPRSSGGPDGAPGEPFGDAAKKFSEDRLLQRAVTVEFLGKSTSGLPIVQLLHPVGNIAVFLLNQGLATIADWQSAQLGAQRMSALRAAEKTAKDGRLNLWKDLAQTPKQTTASKSSNNFKATIAKIISADTYVLKLASTGKEETVQLTSIRAPRKSDAPEVAPYAPISKEVARKNFIGKEVNVTVDAIRPESAQFEERRLVTLVTIPEGKNVGEFLVESGYATVIRHRKDDNDRSPNWDELLEKEKSSIEAGKGIHGKKTPPVDRTVDASETAARAKTYLTNLTRQGKINGVVDHVSTAGRIRIHVPRLNLILTLVHTGVRVPRPQEPYGQQALDYVSDHFYQRDVVFSVENVDKTGAFIGTVYTPGTNEPLPVVLVKMGLAEVHEYSAQQSHISRELFSAQEEAQDAHLNIWANRKSDKEKEKEISQAMAASAAEQEKAKSAGTQKNYVDITVTNVSRNGEVYYRLGSMDAKFKKMSSDLVSYNNSAANSSTFNFAHPPKKGEYVTALPGFIRGRIISFDKPSKTYTIQELDTGKVKTLPASKLRPLPAQFGTKTYPEFAKPAVLSFVKLPPTSTPDYLDEYIETLKSLVEGKRLAANVDSPPTITPQSITIYTEKSTGPNDSVNSYLIDEGYAFVKNKLSTWEKWDTWKSTLAALKDLQIKAQEDHIGVWEYGNVDSDEE